MTPRLKVASPHDYVGTLTNSRRSSFDKEKDSARKRSFSHTTGFTTPARTLNMIN